MKFNFARLCTWFLATCKIPAKFVSLNVDRRAKACDDFQKFACGNFLSCMAPEKVPIEGTNWTKLRIDQMDSKILEMLKGKDSISDAIRKARDLFRSCMNEKKISEVGFESMKMELKRLGFNPTRPPFAGGLDPNFNPMKTLAKLLKFSTIYNNFFMMSIDVMEDPENAGRYVPLIITDPRHSPKNNENYAFIVTNYMYETLGIRPSNSERAVMTDEVEQASVLIRYMQTLTRAVRPEPMIKWTRTTLAHLQNQTNRKLSFEMVKENPYSLGSFDWEVLFENLWDGTVIDPKKFTIYVTNYNALMLIVQNLRKINRDTVAHVLWLTAIQFVSPMSTTKLRSFFLTIDEPLGVLRLKREKQCLAVIKETFKTVVAHAILKNLRGEDKNEATKYATYTANIIQLNVIQKLVKDEFSRLIEETEWMPKSAVKYFISKIDRLKISIPYIETPYDADNLIDDYKDIQIRSSTFYQAYTAILTTNRNKLFSRIFSEPEEFTSSLQYQLPVPSLFDGKIEVVRYYPLFNKIEISFTAIGLPYYYGYQFKVLNLGGFGFQLARQIAHVLDPSNTKRNETLSAKDKIWRQWYEAKYKQRAHPIIKILLQAKNYDSEEDISDMIIDIIGLTVCFRVLEKIYPNLDELNVEEETSHDEISGEQTRGELLTLGVGMTMCQIRNPNNTKKANEYYIDHPDRLNEIFKKSAEFVEIWHCNDPTRANTMNMREKYTMFP